MKQPKDTLDLSLLILSGLGLVMVFFGVLAIFAKDSPSLGIGMIIFGSLGAVFYAWLLRFFQPDYGKKRRINKLRVKRAGCERRIEAMQDFSIRPEGVPLGWEKDLLVLLGRLAELEEMIKIAEGG